jgi:hypothetical protein
MAGRPPRGAGHQHGRPSPPQPPHPCCPCCGWSAPPASCPCPAARRPPRRPWRQRRPATRGRAARAAWCLSGAAAPGTPCGGGPRGRHGFARCGVACQGAPAPPAPPPPAPPLLQRSATPSTTTATTTAAWTSVRACVRACGPSPPPPRHPPAEVQVRLPLVVRAAVDLAPFEEVAGVPVGRAQQPYGAAGDDATVHAGAQGAVLQEARDVCGR